MLQKVAVVSRKMKENCSRNLGMDFWREGARASRTASGL
jgi:hypothetical protein